MNTNLEDSTTTDYVSESDGVDFEYEGHRVGSTTDKAPVVRKDKSPRRKKSPPRGAGKIRAIIQCSCGAKAATRAEDDDDSAGSHSHSAEGSDTEGEDSKKHRCVSSREPKKLEDHAHKDDSGESSEPVKESSKAAGKKKAERKNSKKIIPYIEEYPEEMPRPVMRLREHKVHRRFSTSDETRVRDSEEYLLSSSPKTRGPAPSSGKRRQPGKVTRKHTRDSTHGSTTSSTRPKRRIEYPEEHMSAYNTSSNIHPRQLADTAPPTGRRSESDIDDFLSDEIAERSIPSTVSSSSSTRRRRRQRIEPVAADTELMMTPANIARSSAFQSHSPKYSSSWPMQKGSHYPASDRRRPPRDRHDEPHYEDESDDESSEFEFDPDTDHVYETDHVYDLEDEDDMVIVDDPKPRKVREKRRSKEVSSVVEDRPPRRHSRREEEFVEDRRHSTSHRSHREMVSRPREVESPPSPSPPPIREPPRHRDHHQRDHYRERDHRDDERDYHHRRDSRDTVHDRDPREHRHRHEEKPKKYYAPRTVITNKASMTNIDRAGHGRSSMATELCDVWRGRPEDWESPSASDFVYSDEDGEHREPLQLLEPGDSATSFFSRRSRRTGAGAPSSYVPSRVGDPYSRETSPMSRYRRPTARLDDLQMQMVEEPDDMYDNGGPSTLYGSGPILGGGYDGYEDDGDGLLQFEWERATQFTTHTRAPSRAPSRFGGMSRANTMPSMGLPLERERGGGGRSRSRAPVTTIIFSARKTREFLSPTPTRAGRGAKRFDFEAWDRERRSRSMLDLGLGSGNPFGSGGLGTGLLY